MQEAHDNKNPNDLDNEIDLRELFHVLFQGKWIIISVTSFFSIIGVIYSLLLPNIYTSKSLLVPINPSSGISGALDSYSGLAGLAGVNLPSGGDDSNSVQAIKKLTSLSFFENNILPNIFLPDLMATKSWGNSWDHKTNTMVYDESIYIKSVNKWIRKYSYPQKQIPTPQESFLIFTKHLSLSKDKKTGFVTLNVKHQSPFLAKQWSELLVNEVNAFYRQKDKSESEKSVSYLNKQISMTSLSEVKQIIAELLQDETQKLSLVEASQYYVFDYIDPPAVMEEKSEPKRSAIVILLSLIGLIGSVSFVLMKSYFFREKV